MLVFFIIKMIESTINIFLKDPIWQTLWILWMLSVIYAFLQKDDKKVIKILFISSFFWSWHFFFLEVYAALVSTLVWAFRLLLSLKYKGNIKIFYIILFITIVLWILTYKDFSSLLPITASILATYGFFFLEKIKLRLLLIVCSSFWLSYNYIHFSIWWVINETILHFITIYTIYKIIEVEWTKQYYIEKTKNILLRKKKLDYWRYLVLIDYIKTKKRIFSFSKIFDKFRLK